MSSASTVWMSAMKRSVASSGVPSGNSTRKLNSPWENCGMRLSPSLGTSEAAASRARSATPSTTGRALRDQPRTRGYEDASAPSMRSKAQESGLAAQPVSLMAQRNTNRTRPTIKDGSPSSTAPPQRRIRPGGGPEAAVAACASDSAPPLRAAIMGISVSDTASEAMRENDTVTAMSRNSCEAMPSRKTTGTNTAMVVSVEAMTARPTSEAPSLDASTADRPASRRLKMASSTTMALSTSMPTPRARPPSDMMFSDVPVWYIMKNVATTEMGMEAPMIMVLRRSLRKNSSTRMAKKPPMPALFSTSLMEAWMKRD